MSNYSYVMVTDWKGHWDHCPRDRSSYPTRMMKNGMDASRLVENASTLFIKREGRDGPVSGCWEGTVHTLIEEGDTIWFSVKMNRQIECPSAYREYSNGWYFIDENQDSDALHDWEHDAIITPPLIKAVGIESDYEKFENYVYYLLKAIGINDIIRFQKDNQAGKADGLFEFGSLAVLYDATLRTNFVENKDVQIDNYCAQLEGPITQHNMTFNVHLKQHRMVWIVTRNQGKLYSAEKGTIAVREVPVSKLVEIFYKRYRQEIYRERDLELDLLSFLTSMRGST